MHWTDDPAPLDDQLRAAVRGEMEKASGRAISVSNPLPDALIARVQALQPIGCTLSALLIWIYEDHTEQETSADAFEQWYRSFEAIREGFRSLRMTARP